MGETSEQEGECESLPLLDWEIGHARKRIPGGLRRMIGAPTRWLRVPPAVHAKETLGKHRQFSSLYADFDDFVEEWAYFGKVPGEDKWRIIVYQDERRGRLAPYLIVIAKDRNGSFNLVSLHRRDESYVRRLIVAGELERRMD